jgi:hypothetical protein
VAEGRIKEECLIQLSRCNRRFHNIIEFLKEMIYRQRDLKLGTTVYGMQSSEEKLGTVTRSFRSERNLMVLICRELKARRTSINHDPRK